MIHVAIVRRVRPGREAEFEEALRHFFRETLDDPATSGASFIRPAPGSTSNEYGILRSFRDDDAKEAFYASDGYQRWRVTVAPLVEGEATRDELRGLEGFFRAHGAHAPPAWKMAVVTWLAVNPAVWIWAHAVPGFAVGLPPLAELIVVNTFVVATLTWGFMPVLVKAFRPWLT